VCIDVGHHQTILPLSPNYEQSFFLIVAPATTCTFEAEPKRVLSSRHSFGVDFESQANVKSFIQVKISTFLESRL
jgi:hypothetical protein